MRLLKQVTTIAAVSGAMVLAAAGSASAAGGNPHFIKSATSLSGSGPNVTVKFKEAGLASGSKQTIVISATAATTYECVNGGGMNPAASNKKTFNRSVANSGTFTADRSGNVVGSLTLSPPSAASLGFSCPKGQSVTFVSVSYSGITVTDRTSGATTGVLGSYSYVDPTAPPLR